jgi:BirA family biotin operon repressor/biotin-[acetyl-CoA-carboxylase] ligase
MTTSQLNQTIIQENLFALSPGIQPVLHVLETVDSTNRYLKTALHNNMPTARVDTPRNVNAASNSQHLLACCIAETQTAGQGRFGRHWHSPFGENIYFSSQWRLKKPLSELFGLSLLVGLAVLSALDSFHLASDVQIKWPNDLLWHHKKLAGILIETNQASDVIIGIGLNVNSTQDSSINTVKPWTSLCQISGQTWDRNILVAHLIHQLHHHLSLFQQQNLSAFLTRWQSVDFLHGKMVQILQHQHVQQGCAQGITSKGELCLLDNSGKMHYISSGEASLLEYK